MIKIYLSLILTILYYKVNAQLPAFPEAQGGGARSLGGRGGRIIEVINLDDSGPGSLRAAVEATGPRTIIFKISGTIKLNAQLKISKPYITIAGQSAPGGGILISGENIKSSPVGIATHDVVMRYLKIRKGINPSPFEQDATSIGEGESYNIILDHCSFSWANDETLSIWADSGENHNMTFSYNIISEGLNHDNHSTGLIVGSNKICEQIDKITVHHNLFMHNRNRNPYMKVKDQEVINNIIYNYSWLGTQIAGGVKVDIIGNIYKAGPDNTTRSEIVCRIETTGEYVNCNEGPTGSPSIFIKGNIGPHQSDPSSDQWNTLMEKTGEGNGWGWPGNPPKLTRLNLEFSRPAAMVNYSDFPVKISEVSVLENLLLAEAGASHRIDELGNWIPNRDAVDSRLITEYRDGKGKIIKDEKEVGGFPLIASGRAYLDKDKDGMSDVWEEKYCFNPTDPDDGNEDADGDGFTNVEEFLNGTTPNLCLVTSIDNRHLSNPPTFHPNPSKTKLLLNGDVSENSYYEITTIDGRLIQSGDAGEHAITLENFAPGLYFIRIKTD
ncbi:MAG TPA: T9SS type A sorting domain-containing protein, partial [Cytophagaceae bacterium]